MKIAVVGSINMDMTVTADRIPKKGETLIGDSVQYIPGGKGANQAVAIARLGAEIEMFGCVGDDVFGKQLVDNLKAQEVKTNHIKVIAGSSSGMAFITVGEQDNTIVVVAGANAQVTPAYIDDIADELLKYDVVVLQHEIPLETVEYVTDLCYRKGMKIVLNPAPAFPVSQETIDKVTYLTPNEHEAEILFGSEEQIEDLLRQYPEKLIVTQGSRGVISCTKAGELLQVPARKVEVVDTTGAGDTLNGAFTVRIALGDTLEQALIYANAAASLSIGKFGAQGGMPSYLQVEALLNKQ